MPGVLEGAPAGQIGQGIRRRMTWPWRSVIPYSAQDTRRHRPGCHRATAATCLHRPGRNHARLMPQCRREPPAATGGAPEGV
jgi:hypothetical protein